jgi:CheY-like chemotaxis protein
MVNRRVVLLQLCQLGESADRVANGAEVLEAPTRLLYGLALMDCQMPEVGGYEATRRIRDRDAAGPRRIPIIAMTAHARPAIGSDVSTRHGRPHPQAVKIADLDIVLARPDAMRPPRSAGAHAEVMA